MWRVTSAGPVMPMAASSAAMIPWAFANPQNRSLTIAPWAPSVAVGLSPLVRLQPLPMIPIADASDVLSVTACAARGASSLSSFADAADAPYGVPHVDVG